MLKNTTFAVGKKIRKRWFLPLLQKRNVIINLFNKGLIFVQRKGYTKIGWFVSRFYVCTNIIKTDR
jgi:hypothetical protein